MNSYNNTHNVHSSISINTLYMMWGWDVLVVVEESAMDEDPGTKQARQNVMIT